MRFVVFALLAGCVITRPPELAKRPRWTVVGADTFAGRCVDVHAAVRKSGKQGFGVALRLRSHDECTFEIKQVKLELPSRSIDIAAPERVVLAGRSQRTLWLPVPFDNNSAWNDGDNTATLELATTDGAWRLAMHQGAP